MKKLNKEFDADKTRTKLLNYIMELRDNTILEEFDLIEVIGDNIKDIFSCDLDCSTCSREEMGHCMQTFNKGNLYWIRKAVQYEFLLKNIAEKFGIIAEGLLKAVRTLNDVKDGNEMEEIEELIKEKGIDNSGFYS